MFHVLHVQVCDAPVVSLVERAHVPAAGVIHPESHSPLLAACCPGAMHTNQGLYTQLFWGVVGRWAHAPNTPLRNAHTAHLRPYKRVPLM